MSEEPGKTNGGQDVVFERTAVALVIAGCPECPNLKVDKYYTADPFENVAEWTCGKAAFRRITLHEWNDPKPGIPEWCPLRKVTEAQATAEEATDELQENQMQFGADMVKKYNDVCQSFKRECDDTDNFLRSLGLEPHRTEGGSLNIPKIRRDFQGIELTLARPKIITLCGSSRFCSEMAILSWEFEKGGKIVLGLHLLPQEYCVQKGMLPDENGAIHHIGEQEGVEQQMDALHFKKIEIADIVFVVNVGGYIGSSTAREIAYAEHLGKRIMYLEEIKPSTPGEPDSNEA